MTDDLGGGAPGDGTPDASGVIPTSAGLCAHCLHARSVVSGRGSQFVLCERSKTDARFPRYPPLPVRACAGFEAIAALDAAPRTRLSSADITKNGL